jgi:hypothetical protein
MIRFRKLRVEGYGRFREPAEWHFQPGLNIITGPNEAGKTTLLSALMDAVYENPFSTARDLRERIAWNHPDGWQLELELEEGEQTLSLFKYYPQDPKSNRIRVVLRIGDQVLEDKTALHYWETYWNMPKAVYLATACVRQREMASLLQEKPINELQASLRASATTADLKRVYKMLDDRVKLLKTSRENELKRIETHLLELKRQLDDVRRVYTQRHAARERLRELETQSMELEGRMQQEELTLTLWKQVQENLHRRDELKAREKELFDRLEQLNRLDTRFDTLAQDLEPFGHFGLLPGDMLEQCARIQERLKLAQQDQEQVEAEMEALQHKSDQMVGKQKASLGWLAMGIALFIAASALWQTNKMMAAIAAGLGGFSILVGLLFRKQDPVTTVHMESLQQRLKGVREEVAQAQNELTRLLRKAGFEGEALETEIVLLRDRWEKYRSLLQEQQNILSERQGLLAGTRPEAWREELRDTASARMAHEKALEQPAARALLMEPPDRFIRMESETEAMRQRHKNLHEERLRLEGQLTPLHDLPDPQELTLQIEELQAQHQNLTRQAEVADLTRQLLKETDEQYLSTLESYLTPEIERVLGATTGERYGQVRMGGNLSFTAYHSEREDWLPLELNERAWSAGTLDQLFFSCRLGLCRALGGYRNLPLLLDDPFVHYDPARLRSTLEFLTELAQRNQILLFTCRPLDDGDEEIEGRVTLML